jgi:uncharacterized Rmd1/YagE family protein
VFSREFKLSAVKRMLAGERVGVLRQNVPGAKTDIVWDRPDLERLYARLQDEYELKERAEALSRKLTLISDTAEMLTDMIDTQRSLRLEIMIVLLILFEIVITSYQIVTR